MYQILAYVLSGTTFMGVIGSVAYYKQNRRLKEAEVKEKEVDVERAKIEARKSEIDLLFAQLERTERACEQKDKRLSELNEAINKHIDRRRELADRLSSSEIETNRVNMLLNEAKNDVIRLTEERDFERSRADYAEMWRCEWNDCQDPRGRKPPRNLAGLKYSPPKRVSYKIA